MPISLQLKKDLEFISALDPSKQSANINLENEELMPIENGSSLCHFFLNCVRWLKYLITYTLVPRNPKLDAVSNRIIHEFGKEFKKGTQFFSEEKNFATTSLRIWKKILKNNCGKIEKITKLIIAIDCMQEIAAPQAPKIQASVNIKIESPKEANAPLNDPQKKEEKKAIDPIKDLALANTHKLPSPPPQKPEVKESQKNPEPENPKVEAQAKIETKAETIPPKESEKKAIDDEVKKDDQSKPIQAELPLQESKETDQKIREFQDEISREENASQDSSKDKDPHKIEENVTDPSLEPKIGKSMDPTVISSGSNNT